MKLVFPLLVVMMLSCNYKEVIEPGRTRPVLTFIENGVFKSFDQAQVKVEIFENMQGGSKVIFKVNGQERNLSIEVNYTSSVLKVPASWCLSSYSNTYHDYPARYFIGKEIYFNPNFTGNIYKLDAEKMSMRFEGTFSSGSGVSIRNGALSDALVVRK